jgi:hypothetical protein
MPPPRSKIRILDAELATLYEATLYRKEPSGELFGRGLIEIIRVRWAVTDSDWLASRE